MRALLKATINLVLAMVGAVALFAAPASATEALTYIDFVGTCSDCADYGVGVLTLQNFTAGADLTYLNFVDFTYTSNLATVDITRASLHDFTANFGALPGTANVSIQQATPTGDNAPFVFSFFTSLSADQYTGATWALYRGVPSIDTSKPAGGGGAVNDDFGTAYTWSVASDARLPTSPDGGIPEPSAWTLLVAGFGLAGGRLRARRTGRAAEAV